MPATTHLVSFLLQRAVCYWNQAGSNACNALHLRLVT